jgi:hypothetical protein
MTDPEIELFRARVKRKDLPSFYWRSPFDYNMTLRVAGIKTNYVEPGTVGSEPVAVLKNGTVVSLYNSELADFVEISISPAFY